MGPVTIIVTALALGAANGLKDVAEDGIKELYSALKQIIRSKYDVASDALEMVEKIPESQTRQTVLEEDLIKAGAAEDTYFVEKAEQLIGLAKSRMSEDVIAKVGVEIRDVKGGNLEIRRIHSQEKGVVVTGSKFKGDVIISDVNTTGGEPLQGKKKNP